MTRIAVSLLAIALLILFAGCRSSNSSSQPVVLTAQQQNGQKIFASACAGCHNGSSDAKGPNLKGLYRKQYLPSGLPANDRFVQQTIIGGRGVMPGLGDSISDQQLSDLVAYLHAT